MQETIGEAGNVTALDDWQAGLMVALLAVAPIRVANFAALRIALSCSARRIRTTNPDRTRGKDYEDRQERHLARAWLPLSLSDLPSGRGATIDFGAGRHPGDDHAALRVGSYGQPLGQQGARKRILGLTRAVFARQYDRTASGTARPWRLRSGIPTGHARRWPCSATAPAALPRCLRVGDVPARLRRSDVELVSITQDISGGDATANVLRQMLSVFDEHQSRENSKHTSVPCGRTPGSAIGIGRSRLLAFGRRARASGGRGTAAA